jgi:hypothetical protein
MVNKSVNLELSQEVWEIIDKEFKLNGELDAEILSNIIRNHLAEHGFHPNIYSLTHGHGVKDYLETHETMIMSIVELLEEKGLATYNDWAKIMDQKIMKE